MSVDIGDLGSFKFVERVAGIELHLEHFVAVAIPGEKKDAGDLAITNERENFVTILAEALPGIPSFLVGLFGPESAGTENFELRFRSCQGVEEPGLLEFSEHVFAL